MNFELEQSPFLGTADPNLLCSQLEGFSCQGWPVTLPGWKAKMCVKAWTRAVIKPLFPRLYCTPVLLPREHSHPQWISERYFWGRVFNLSSVLLPALLVIHISVDDKDQLQPPVSGKDCWAPAQELLVCLWYMEGQESIRN